MTALETRIDDLYRLPPKSFTTERNALAKTLTKGEAQLVKRLAKPTTPAWAVNQVYWHARPLYDRLLKAGAGLRAAQLAALQGGDKNIRAASDAHRKLLAEVMTAATRLASDQGLRVGPEELTPTLEAISLVPEHPEQPGRLTRVHRLTGFEGLQGVTPRALPAKIVSTSKPSGQADSTDRRAPRPGPAGTRAAERRALVEAARKAQAARQEQVRLATERRRLKAAIVSAERTLERARRDEAKARAGLERAQKAVHSAEIALGAARDRVPE